MTPEQNSTLAKLRQADRARAIDDAFTRAQGAREPKRVLTDAMVEAIYARRAEQTGATAD